MPGVREWLVNEHIMGNLSMGNPNVQGNFIDDEWHLYGPELEGPGNNPNNPNKPLITLAHVIFTLMITLLASSWYNP